MDAKTVSGFALVAVSVGVAVGFLASSTTNLHVSSAVRPAVTSRPAVVSATPSFRGAPRTEVSASQADIQEAADVQFVQAAASTGASAWATGAFFAAAGAVGAAILAVRQKAHSAYQAIQEDPEAVVAQAGRALGVAVTSAALAGSASAASLTYDEIQSLSYMEMKGTGLSNTCPIISDSTGNKLSLKAGKYSITNMCLEPSSFQVKVPSPDGKTVTDFEKTKLMTRLTYTLDGIRADLDVAGDGSWNIQEIDGIDYAATTVQLAGGERVPFLFTVKNLAAKGDGSQFLGQFDVPSYRGATFLDPKGRGGATGYDTAVALPAAGDDEEYSKENTKSAAGAVGTIAFKVAKVNAETGEIAGVFESIQPSDTDLGAKVPKDVKTSGVWYGQISPA